MHPTTLVLGSMLFAAISATAPRAKAADNDKRDPAVHEAQAARQEARQGKLKDNATPEERERNKYARCEYLQGDDREYCIRRINGEGTVSGSVEGGGLLRELRVEVPAEKR
jgi:hypothetical protein